MNTLTVNLHVLFGVVLPAHARAVQGAHRGGRPSRPTAGRSMEQLRLHGVDPRDGLIVVAARAPASRPAAHRGRRGGSSRPTATRWRWLWLAGVQYVTGQVLDVERLTAAGHAAGALVGLGPGARRGQRPAAPPRLGRRTSRSGAPTSTSTAARARSAGRSSMSAGAPIRRCVRLAGWWGNDPATRFHVEYDFVPRPGAAGWQAVQPAHPVAGAAHAPRWRCSTRWAWPALRARSERLTAHLADLVAALAPVRRSSRRPTRPPAARCSSSGCRTHAAVLERMEARGHRGRLPGAGHHPGRARAALQQLSRHLARGQRAGGRRSRERSLLTHPASHRRSRWSTRSRAAGSTTSSRRPVAVHARVRAGDAADVDRAVAAAAAAFPGWSAHTRGGALARPAAHRGRAGADLERFVAGREHRRGQAGRARATAGHPACGRQPALLRDGHPAHGVVGAMPPTGRRPELRAAPAAWRGGADLALEPAALPVHLEGRAGPRDRQHGRRQAVGADAADRIDAGQAAARSRACRRACSTSSTAWAPTAGAAIVGHPDIPTISFTGGTVTGARDRPHRGAACSRSCRWSWAARTRPSCSTTRTSTRRSRASSAPRSRTRARSASAARASWSQERLFDRFVDCVRGRGAGSCASATRSTRSTEQGALVSRAHRDKVEGYVALAREQGGEIVTGGARPDRPAASASATASSWSRRSSPGCRSTAASTRRRSSARW